MNKAASESTADHESFEYIELKRFILWMLWSMVLQIIFTVGFQIFSGSLTLGAVLIESTASLLLHVFNLIIIRIILRHNPFSHPYGTGKLENFAGFLYAILAIPGGLWILVSAYNTCIGPLQVVNLGFAAVPMFIFLIRAYCLFLFVRRIAQRQSQPSPMTIAYVVNMKVTTISDAMMLLGLLIGYVVSLTKNSGIAIYFDVGIALFIGLYMLYSAVQVLLANFKSLVDMPLPEQDQLIILQALTAHFNAYEDIGNIFSQLSGSTRLIQIELYVKPGTTAKEINQLMNNIQKHLKHHFEKMVFHLIPLLKEDAREPIQTITLCSVPNRLDGLSGR